MSKNNLTANQAAVLDAIAEGFYTADDEFGGIFDTFAADLADRGTIKDKKTAKVVLNQLTKKRILAVNAETDEISLTEAGKFAISEIQAEDDNSESLASAEEAGEYTGHAEAFEAEEEEDLLGTSEIPVVETAPAADPVTVETIAENYTVKEWTEEGTEADVEWTETTFKDGSMTLKRRQKVSGSWRTDYWGMEADQTKKHFTSAKACKMARAYGTYTEAI